MRDRLDPAMRALIARRNLMVVGTSDGYGRCDCTLRSGPPGFVRVLDERRLVWPEYRGNGVHASAGNIRENPHVGLVFPDPGGAGAVLHVAGLADLTDDLPMRRDHPDLPIDPVPGRRAQLWVTVFVDRAYLTKNLEDACRIRLVPFEDQITTSNKGDPRCLRPALPPPGSPARYSGTG